MKNFLFLMLLSFSALAQESVGQVSAGGLVFSDTLQVLVFDDPDVAGVSCYVTYYDRSLTLNDSSVSSISCRKVGPISGNLSASSNVFHMSKSLFFKSTQVQRFYDSRRGVLVYLAYSRNGGKNASHSLSVVPVSY